MARRLGWGSAAALAGLVLLPGAPDAPRPSAAERAELDAGPAGWADDLRPIGPGDWSYDRAAHLLERAGFGGTPEEIRQLARLSPEAAVDRHKRREVAQVAREYLKRLSPMCQWRFDIVSVYYERSKASRPQIEVFRNASLAS